MTKRRLIDEIVSVNRSAKPAFLAGFDDYELDDYLQHLRLAQGPRSGTPCGLDAAASPERGESKCRARSAWSDQRMPDPAAS